LENVEQNLIKIFEREGVFVENLLPKKRDFRKLTALMICLAEEESDCLRYKPGMSGCTFQQNSMGLNICIDLGVV
jgi:hypothetical protein